MAKREKLTCLEKRDLLSQSAVAVEELTHLGKCYEEAGLIHDAVDFYEKAHAGEALERVLEKAREEGDVFLFKRLCRVLNCQPEQDEWLSIAQRAEELGKLSFSAEARREAGVDVGQSVSSGVS